MLYYALLFLVIALTAPRFRITKRYGDSSSKPQVVDKMNSAVVLWRTGNTRCNAALEGATLGTSWHLFRSTADDNRGGTFSLVEWRDLRASVGPLSEGHHHIPNGESRQANIRADDVQGRIG